MGLGIRIFVDSTQAKAPETVLLASMAGTWVSKKFCPLEGMWHSLMESWGESLS